MKRKPRAPATLIAKLRGGVRDRELEVGTTAHYEDPAYYGTTYRRRIADVAYYVDLARKVLPKGGALLELGIGNGRIALPLARHGYHVVGIDASAPMLADLRRRLTTEATEVRQRIEPHRGDMRKKKLGRKFGLVLCTFNTALHLFTREDIETFFARVKEHLAPGGLFVIDLSTPMPFDLARDPEAWHGAPQFNHPAAGRVRYKERFEYDALRQILFVTMKFTPTKPDSGFDEWITPLAHRQFFPAEFEALLHYNGFDAVALHGDWAGGPLVQNSDVMIWHAKARAPKPRKR